MALSREVPAHLRRLPRGQVAVRITRAAADTLFLISGWQAWPRSRARSVARFCRARCGPTPRSKRDDCPYTPAEKTVMRRLADQLEARLCSTPC